ncbi:MAG: response regulator, partial [Desulfobacterales bacterium]|nr:response regulator [Desulfobacterales bacterium]
IDYLKIISKFTGIEFETIPVITNELDLKAKALEVDIFPTFKVSDREPYTNFTNPFMYNNRVIITRSSDSSFITNLNIFNGKKAAIVKGLKIYKKTFEEYPKIKLIEKTTLLGALESVSKSEADVYVGGMIVEPFLIQKNNLFNLKIAGVMDFPPVPYMFGVRKDYPELIGILNKAIALVTKEEQKLITQKYFSVKFEYKTDWYEILKWSAFISSIFIVILGISLLWNRRLANEINMRKSTENELKKAKETAERATRIKSEFLANMSHEIRTPMNAIMGMSKLLLENEHSSQQKKYLNIINSAADNLLIIINDILDISKIEANKIEFDYQNINIYEVVNDIKNILHLPAFNKGIKLIGEVDKDLPFIRTDPIRLKQIILNLGNNAVKFTERGEVSINVRSVKETDTNITLSISVIDTGIGIPKGKKELLFQPFLQLSNDMTKKNHGTGLGLVISKRLVELMGGIINVESEEGKGSTFCFVITFEKGSSGNALEYEDYITDINNINENLKILVAEDNLFNQEVIKGFIKKHKLTMVLNGEKVIEILKENTFDIILMDIQMPLMDGITATKIIRDKNSNVLNHDIPIVAMTAYAMKEDIDLCFKSGMNGYISKPISSKKLNLELIKVLGIKPGKRGNNQEINSKNNQFNSLSIMQLVNNDIGLALNITEIFVNNYIDIITEVKNAINNNDAEKLEIKSYKLKGEIGYFSDFGRELAFKLQQMGKNKDLLNANDIYEELKKEVETLIPLLKDFVEKNRNFTKNL